MAVTWNESFGALNGDVNLWRGLGRCFLPVMESADVVCGLMCLTAHLILHKVLGDLPAKVLVQSGH